MTVKKTFLLTALIGVAVTAAPAQSAESLQTTAQTRGTVKVRPRFFDPFAVQQSRLQIDPFGFFTVQTANPFAVSAPGAAPAAKSTTVASSAATLPAAAATGSDIELAPVVQVSNARVPFRPPVRSPFRPPPRPPF